MEVVINIFSRYTYIFVLSDESTDDYLHAWKRNVEVGWEMYDGGESAHATICGNSTHGTICSRMTDSLKCIAGIDRGQRIIDSVVWKWRITFHIIVYWPILRFAFAQGTTIVAWLTRWLPRWSSVIGVCLFSDWMYYGATLVTGDQPARLTHY